MTLIPRSHIIATATCIALSNQVNAACSRDDVTFYLDKGFSTEQISVMCSSTSAGVKSAADTQQSNAKNKEQGPSSTVTDENALYLQRAIKAKNIKLNTESLQYTQKICIEYGEEDLFGFTPKACSNVKLNITLKGLEVVGTGKKYGFYGTPEVRVKATVTRVTSVELKNMNAEEREIFIKKLNNGKTTAIPVRDDFSLEKVSQLLQQLSN